MTTKRSKNPRSEAREEAGEDDVSDDDSSSEEGLDSTAESSPPLETDVVGRDIRRHALELLRSFPERGHLESGNARDDGGGGGSPESPGRYRSYQYSPGATRATTSAPSSRVDYDATAATTAPWGGGYGNDDGGGGLSLAGVASMAFACVATCLTEGYRAASNYYGGYYEGTRYPPPVAVFADTNGGGMRNYHHVPSYRDSTPDDRTSAGGNVVNGTNGYIDGRRTKVGDGEVMERGISTHFVDNEKMSQTIGGIRTQQDEWEKVHVPSTYQGGGAGR
ncbi:hypothetical protein ACHAW5_002989 [Stephanodiscus triporus]|uniref:Uncharacterized protein n=1 Tax=Stephanodiscus triporus TaxID=2934178 RepID=A0ABD3NGQ5_9STRA